MAAVPVVLELPARKDPQQEQPAEIRVTDMDEFSADNKCACAASDDNPF